MAEIIDLRSDTVTMPTPEMIAAMASAEVGDDVYREDPTINRLEEMGAKKMGKEAGLFVSSGTMGNLLAIMTHCSRGDEVIMGNLAHTFLFEGGGVAALAGVQPHTLPNLSDGTLAFEDIRAAIRAEDVHFPVTRLLILENTHNRCGGTVLPLEYLGMVGELAKEKGLLMHLDGARIFNAADASDISAAELAEAFDSVSFCLSKGLCAPVGSVLCGPNDFINKARRFRKMIGGGMRQAGILAAAGIVALEKMTTRLGDDHLRARQLSKGLSGIGGINLRAEIPPTNMVFISLEDQVKKSAFQIAEGLKERNIKVGIVGPRQIRMVTHYWINDDMVLQTIDAFRKVV